MSEINIHPGAAPDWTTEMTDQLVKLLDQGMSRGKAAKILGVTRNAAIGRAYRIGYQSAEGRKRRARQLQQQFLARLTKTYDEAVLCRIQNNNCPAPPVVIQNASTKCKTERCNNTRLPGYRHGLCNVCNRKRLAMEREAA